MTRPTDPLFDQRITDWLEDDPTQAPDQLLDIVLAALPSISRRRTRRAPGRFVTLSTSIRWLVAAAVVIGGVLALGGTLYLLQPRQPAVGNPSDTPGQSNTFRPSESPRPRNTPGQTSTPGPSDTPGPSSSGVQPMAASWTVTGNMVTPRHDHTATLLPNGKVLVAGGLIGDRGTASAELYDPSTGTWTATGNMVTSRSLHTATLLPDGKVLVTGGDNAGSSSAELYDPSSGTWSATGNMLTPRSLDTATLLPDGKVLVAGGVDNTKVVANGGSPDNMASAELYDPGTGSWTATGNMVTPRRDHTAMLLRDGKVLVAGGYDNNNAAEPNGGYPEITNSAELYDPDTGSWAGTRPMLTPRAGHAATLLPDGKVLVASTDANLYDPGTGFWTSTASPGWLGGGPTATLLRDGTVLGVFDGRAAELYDPSAGSWTLTANGTMIIGSGATATLLRDGTVLVAGGEVPGATLASAEVYHPGSPPAPPVPLPSTGALAPGTYSLANPFLGDNPPLSYAGYQRIFLTLPAGWAIRDGLVYKHLGQPDEVTFSVWTVDQVYADPCHWQGSTLGPLDLANHYDNVTGAFILAPQDGGLANQAFRGALPRPLSQVLLGGVPALRIDLSVPAQLDVSTCDKGQFRSWTEWQVAGGANSHNAPGQLDAVYEVDVDRHALVIDASHMPATSGDNLAELEAIVASMIIDR